MATSEARERACVEPAKSSRVEGMKDTLDLLTGQPLALLASLLLGTFACAGQPARDGAQAPVVATSVGSATPSSSAGAPPSSASAATTTTETLADSGNPQGSKLPEAHAAASASVGADAVPKGPHEHDPGRGIQDIAAIVKAHRDEARACYDKALPDHPGIEGDLVITWTIDPKGNVTQTGSDSSRSQISEPSVVKCVSDVVKRIQFAGSPGGFETKASFPFNFHPKHGKSAQ